MEPSSDSSANSQGNVGEGDVMLSAFYTLGQVVLALFTITGVLVVALCIIAVCGRRK